MDFFHILLTIIRKMSGTPFKGPPERKNFKKKKNVTKIAYMGRMTGIVFLELGRFKKRISELETVFEKWIYLLKNMHRMTEIPAEFSEPLFERLFLLAEIGNFTPDEMRQYYNSLENMGDYDNIIHTAQEEAEKRGLEKGRAEGRTEAQEEMARKLKALGVDIDTIVEATGMDRDVVVNL